MKYQVNFETNRRKGMLVAAILIASEALPMAGWSFELEAGKKASVFLSSKAMCDSVCQFLHSSGIDHAIITPGSPDPL